MTTEEQDAIVGRMIREYGELRSRKAVYEHQMGKYGHDYQDVGRHLILVSIGGSTGVLPNVPDATQVLLDQNELSNIRDRYDKLLQHLKDTGVTLMP